MAKVDLLLAAAGALALLASVAGVAFYDDLTGEADLTFPERGHALARQESDLRPGGVAELTWNATANATAALLDVALSFSGQAVQGGAAVVELRLTAPDGSVNVTRTTWDITAGATSAAATFQAATRWAQPPADVRADPTLHDASVAWDRPLLLRVVVTPPPDAAPLASYAFHAAAEGVLLAFAAEAAPAEAA